VPTYRDEIANGKSNEWIQSCPSEEGGHNWQAMSYYAPSNLLIIPLSQSCDELNGHDVERKAGSGGVAAAVRVYEMPGTNGNMGKLAPIDAENDGGGLVVPAAGAVSHRRTFNRGRHCFCRGLRPLV